MSRPSLSGLPTGLAGRIDDRCDAFEAAWPHSPRPRLTDYIDGFDGDDRLALLRALLRLELELRRAAGEVPHPDEYLAYDGVAVRSAFREVLTAPYLPAPVKLKPEADGREVMGPIGRGGFSDVYLAYDPAFKRYVALKVLRAGSVLDEAQKLAQFSHDNVARVYNAGSTRDGRPYLEMEYVAGGSLARRLDGKPLPPDEAARLVEVLARAVQAIHDRDVLHLDLKPANVLLAPPTDPRGVPTPKITDFGLARVLGAIDPDRRGRFAGTPSYAAPEQAEGREADIGPRTDVYALGAILYECLTGRPPFKAATDRETLRQVVGQAPAPPRALNPQVDRGLQYICLKCLEKDPARRYGSAVELAADLKRWSDGEAPDPGFWRWLWCELTSPGRVEQPAAWSRLCLVLGLWSLAGHTAFFLLLLWAGAGVGALWAWFVAFHGGSWPLTRLAIRSRSRLDRLERGFMLNWVAAEVTRALLFALFCPPWGPTEPERVALVYPAFAAVRGLLWVVQARQFWGRFLAVGLVCFVMAPALIAAGVWAPLIFGLVNAACLLWLAAGLRRVARDRQRPVAAVLTPSPGAPP
jgi:serine/threonine-protein kinase